jgi:20S proteasome subunit beta 4
MRGATVLKASDDKTRRLNSHTLMAFSGEAGDTGTHTPLRHSTGLAKIEAHNVYSAIRRIHPSQRPAILDAQQHGAITFSHRELRPGRTRTSAAIKETVYGEPAARRLRQDCGQADVILDRLPSEFGPGTVCRTRLRTVCSPRPGNSSDADCSFRYYCLSILDKHHHPDIDYEQAMKVLRMCTQELKRRLPIDFKGVLVKVITKDGIKVVDYEDDVKVDVP